MKSSFATPPPEATAEKLNSSNKRKKHEASLKLVCIVWVVGFGFGYHLQFLQGLCLLQSSNNKRITIEGAGKHSERLKAVTAKYGAVTRIALLGERNSGTSWMVDELDKCFPNLSVTPGLGRDKHWFQSDDQTEVRVNTVVIAMFRNPYDWLQAMRRRPHHAPLHLHLHWRDFATKAWTMPRPERDLPWVNLTGPICQEGFDFKHVVPCLRPKQKSLDIQAHAKNFSGWDPFYELQYPSGTTAYSSILELRADKIRNFLSIETWDWVGAFHRVQYERLLQEGTGWLLQLIERSTGHEAQCEPVPPAPDRLSNYKHRKSYFEFMNENVDWEAEELIGYQTTTEAEAIPSLAFRSIE